MLKAGAAILAVVGLTGQMMAARANMSGWAPCPQFGSLSCAYLDVPLDYHDTSAGHGQLLVVKANATGERKGTIFLNPGELAHAYIHNGPANACLCCLLTTRNTHRRSWRIRALDFGNRRRGPDEPDRGSLRLRELGPPRSRALHLVRSPLHPQLLTHA